jgi:hypothetical protein
VSVVSLAAAGIAVGTASGADSLRVAAGLALVDRLRALPWVASLIAADGAALLVGVGLGTSAQIGAMELARALGLAVLAVFAGAAVLGGGEGLERALTSRSLSVGVPVLLSLDSLLAGGALGALGYPLAVVFPIAIGTSAGLCLLGYAVGALFHGRGLALVPIRLGGVVMAIAIVVAVATG